MLIELFSLGVAAEPLRVIICSKLAISLQRGSVDPNFRWDRPPPTNHSFLSANYDKLSFVWYKNLNISFFRFVTIHAIDGRTNRQTDRRTDGHLSRDQSALHSIQRGKIGGVNRFNPNQPYSFSWCSCVHNECTYLGVNVTGDSRHASVGHEVSSFSKHCRRSFCHYCKAEFH